jgi:N-acetylated-alpha-linked acidic dipeptidase
LAKKGLRPKRTLVYCAWDGEEPALLGSTEWVEDHQDELKQKAVAYINSDGNSRGFISASGSHTLETFFNEIMNDVIDPQTGATIKERRYARTVTEADKQVCKVKRIRSRIRLFSLSATPGNYINESWIWW